MNDRAFVCVHLMWSELLLPPGGLCYRLPLHVGPLEAQVYTASGWPAVSTPVLRQLAGKPGAAQEALDKLIGKASDQGALLS